MIKKMMVIFFFSLLNAAEENLTSERSTDSGNASISSRTSTLSDLMTKKESLSTSKVSEELQNTTNLLAIMRITDEEQERMYYPIAYKIFLAGRIESIKNMITKIQQLGVSDETIAIEEHLSTFLGVIVTKHTKITEERTLQQREAAASDFLKKHSKHSSKKSSKIRTMNTDS